MARDSQTKDVDSDQTVAPTSSSQDQITDAIRQAYDDVANEPLPDKLNDLLEQLRQSGK